MHPLDAIRAMVNEYPGGDEALHRRVSPSKSLEAFQKELRGNGGFKLGLLDAALIAEYCHEAGCASSAALATAFAGRCNATLRVRHADSGREGGVLQNMGKLMSEFSAAGLDGQYTLNEVRRIRKEVAEAMAALQTLEADIEAAHEAGRPQHLRQAHP